MKFKYFSYNKVKSTNLSAMHLINKKKFQNGFVHAVTQTTGRGRYGRKWISKKGNLFGTFFFEIKKNYPTVNQFNKINTLLNIEVIQKFAGQSQVNFKPPNDIYLNKKKVCGILQEVITKDKKKYLIVGIGINLVSNPIIKKYITTNIFKETNVKPNLNKFIKTIINKYETFFKNIKKHNFSAFNLKTRRLSLG